MLFDALKRVRCRKHRLFGTETAEFRRLARKRESIWRNPKRILWALESQIDELGGAVMKIFCTNEEFAKLADRCDRVRRRSGCGRCLLSVCASTGCVCDGIRPICEIAPDYKAKNCYTEDDAVDVIENVISSSTGCHSNKNGLALIRNVVKQFGATEAIEAANIAVLQYCASCPRTRCAADEHYTALTRLGGICYNRRKGCF